MTWDSMRANQKAWHWGPIRVQGFLKLKRCCRLCNKMHINCRLCQSPYFCPPPPPARAQFISPLPTHNLYFFLPFFKMGRLTKSAVSVHFITKSATSFQFQKSLHSYWSWMSSLLIGSHRVRSPASLRDGPSVFGQIIWLVQIGTSSSNGLYP